MSQSLLLNNGCLQNNPTSSCSGAALDYVLKNSFSEAAGARPSFPKVLVVITDGKSQDPVAVHARLLRNAGVEVFVVGELRHGGF